MQGDRMRHTGSMMDIEQVLHHRVILLNTLGEIIIMINVDEMSVPNFLLSIFWTSPKVIVRLVAGERDNLKVLKTA